MDAGYFPTIDPVYFPSTPSAYLWSSSSVAGSPSSGWAVYFGLGGAASNVVVSSLRARCVR